MPVSTIGGNLVSVTVVVGMMVAPVPKLDAMGIVSTSTFGCGMTCGGGGGGGGSPAGGGG